MQPSTAREAAGVKLFFVLVFVLAIPFWLIGGYKLPLPIPLPASALGTFVPAAAAAIVSHRQSGSAGVKALIRRAWDYRRTERKIWYLPALLMAPAMYLCSYLIMHVGGLDLPAAPTLPLYTVPVAFVAFLITNMGEELGWSGYALEPLQRRWGVAKASLFLGILWAIWHAIPFVQTREPVPWVAWQSLKTVAMRVVLVWIYYRTGKSTFGATLYHATDNVSWSLFPTMGSHYNPLVTGALTWLIAGSLLLWWRLGASTRGQRVGAEQL
jgi:membrane protease YdiL (CAAX protease family)